MFDFLKTYLLWPAARFVFEFLGDRPWLAFLIVIAVAYLVWRFCWPVVALFYKVFGWKGIGLILVGVLTLGAFGAGWRAHRDSVKTGVDSNDPLFDLRNKTQPKPPKPPVKKGTRHLDENGYWKPGPG